MSFPSPLQAALLTMMGAFFSGAIALVASEWVSMTAALGIGTVFGFGAAGALGAANVPSPHGERLGLRGLRARHLLPLLLLVPVAIVGSEVDNIVSALFPAPDAPAVAQQTLERVPTDTRLAVIETLVVVVGLVPVVEEWFFRGVLQQGLVASVGARGGIFLTALFFALGHGGPGISAQAYGALLAQSFLFGVIFGFARLATGSILASILVHVGVNGLGVAALAAPQWISIPGYNAPGAHTPAGVMVAASLAVVVGIALLARERPPPVPAPAAKPPPGED